MHKEYQPAAGLREVIACFWHTRKGIGEQKSSFEVQPDGYAEIIFYFGSTCSILQSGELQRLPSPFLMGLLNKPAVFHTERYLDPWMVFDLLGLPAGPAEVLVFEHPIAKFHAVLNTDMQQGRVEEAIRKLQQYFLDAYNWAPDRLLSKAGAVLRDRKGHVPVNQLAASAHATVRTLERKFKRSAGHTVKDVSALIRFEQVRNELWHNPNVNLSSLAHELGYTDQAHLSRAFKRYSGSSPRAFARKALASRSELNFVAFIQA
jgi:AraC-like DNA-binding protein